MLFHLTPNHLQGTVHLVHIDTNIAYCIVGLRLSFRSSDYLTSNLRSLKFCVSPLMEVDLAGSRRRVMYSKRGSAEKLM